MISNMKASFAPAQVLVVALVLVVAGSIQPVNAQPMHDLHDFSTSSPSHGLYPQGSLFLDKEGNLYGATGGGGAFGDGTVFKLTPSGTETVLHSFNGPDGLDPHSGLLLDGRGNLYGTTFFGGTSYVGALPAGPAGYGTVFKLDASGNETVLHSFNCSDGASPEAALIMDREGNLYGTTSEGGQASICDAPMIGSGICCGTVFKLSPSGKFTVLHSFLDGPEDGTGPAGPLLLDEDGNLYGVTGGGGTQEDGTIFKLDRSGHETILHSFTGLDGVFPFGPLIRDWAGNLYGAASINLSGASNASGSIRGGTVFKLDRDGKLNIIHNFGIVPDDDGTFPDGLVMDRAGNLFGTTLEGGTADDGTLFKIDREGKETVLYNFGADPSHPALQSPTGNLIIDWRGNIYGVCTGFQTAGSVFMFGADPQQDDQDVRGH
jgi:uncharacterized repeat protein (TIGR03803 family)